LISLNKHDFAKGNLSFLPFMFIPAISPLHTSEERKSNTQCIIKTIPWNYTALKLDWYSTDCKHKMNKI